MSITGSATATAQATREVERMLADVLDGADREVRAASETPASRRSSRGAEPRQSTTPVPVPSAFD